MQWRYLMAAMRSSALGMPRTQSDATNHYVVHRLFLTRTEQIAKLLVHLRRTTFGTGTLFCAQAEDKARMANNKPAQRGTMSGLQQFKAESMVAELRASVRRY